MTDTFSPLKTLRAQSFQVYEDVTIELGQLSVLIGQGDSGKSALLRALRAVFLNDGVDEDIRHGEKKATVTLEFEDGVIIEWSKERKKGGCYRMGDQEFSKTGGQVPEDIAAYLGIGSIEVDATTELFSQLSDQHDTPFLLWETGSKRARILGKATRLDCVVPGTRILMRNLHWVPVESLKTGDEVIGFDENLSQPGGTRRYRAARVETYGCITRPLYEVTLATGESLRCTGEHKWLVWGDHQEETSCRFHWVTTEDMANKLARDRYIPQYKIPRFMVPWETDTSYDAGLLAGAFDADGTLAGRKEKRSVPNFSQNRGTFLTRVQQALEARGYDYGTWEGISGSSLGNKDAGHTRLEIRGGYQAQLRFLGSIRPVRLLEKWYQEDRFVGHRLQAMEHVPIVSVKPIGEGEIVLLGTDAKTYLAEGFPAHNTVISAQMLCKKEMDVAKRGLEKATTSLTEVEEQLEALPDYEALEREVDEGEGNLQTLSDSLARADKALDLAERLEEVQSRATAVDTGALLKVLDEAVTALDVAERQRFLAERIPQLERTIRDLDQRKADNDEALTSFQTQLTEACLEAGVCEVCNGLTSHKECTG